MVGVILAFWWASILISIVFTLIYTSTNRVWGPLPPLPHPKHPH
jgi:hypothetical protein